MRKRVLQIFLTAYAVVSAVIFLFPTVMTIANSFMTEKEINANYGAMISNFDDKEQKKTYISEKLNLKIIPDKVTFDQYKTVLFKSSDYLMKFWNSVLLVAPIVFFQIFVALLAAYSFARYRGKFKEILFFVYVILMLMPYQVTLVPNYLVADWFGILNTRWSIILPGIFAPFSVFLLAKIMRRIPSSYIEAAKLDGAGEIQIFTQICLPLSRSAIFSVSLLLFIDYWNMVEQPLIMLSDSDYHPLSVFLSKINTGDVGLAFAVAVIYMIPTLLMFFYGEDYLVEGITYSGGIKG
ncbi:MAG: carbohydrate ABC transporter permease [Oscillospiraceae bacterium]|nr:carbohydrate ABC transporter permease [Oscillospiraceae bacterium]